MAVAIQYKISLINDRLNLLLTDAGNAAVFRIYSGSMPANCAASATGTKLTDDALPTTWMGSSSAGVVSKSGTWTLNGVAAGTAGYFRILDSGLAATYMQGTVTATGGGGDMTLDNAVIASSQVITVSVFQITGGNA
jgi:hypothetical protein